MSFRSRLILTSVPLALLPLAVFAFGVRREMDVRLRAQYAARVDEIAGVVAQDIERESASIQARLQSLARRMEDDNRLRVALLAGTGDERRFLLDYAQHAMPLAALDVLQMHDETGRILSSGHFRNDFDRVDAALPSRLRSSARSALAELRTPRGSVHAFVHAVDVRIGTRTVTLVGGRTVDASFLERLERGSGLSVSLETSESRTASSDGEIVRTVEVPFVTEAAPEGEAHFVVRQSLGPLAALRRGVTRWFVLATAAAAVLATLLAIWIASRISRPISELAARTRNLDLDRLDADFGTRRTDELGLLEKTLGELAGRLRSSVARLREAERRATVGEIARQVNHDVRNGLVPIRNVVQHLAQLARENPGELRDVFLERQTTLDGSITYLQSLASNYARLSASLERTPCDVNAIVRDVLHGAAGDGVRVRAELANRLPAVIGDPVALRRILENLVTNAVESLPARAGEVLVSTRVGSEDRSRIEIVVADTGSGMSESELQRVFDDYYTTKERGTGLGLSIVRRLITDLGGSIRVQSEPSKGTQFVIELPAAEQASAQLAYSGEHRA